jgi:hypothetical protein
MWIGRFFYWLATGAILAFGLISFISFILLPCLLIAGGLAIYGVKRWHSCEVGALLIGLGGLPALIFLLNILAAGGSCSSMELGPNSSGEMLSCNVIPSSYYTLDLVFAGIMLLGVAVTLLQWQIRRRQILREQGDRRAQ